MNTLRLKILTHVKNLHKTNFNRSSNIYFKTFRSKAEMSSVTLPANEILSNFDLNSPFRDVINTQIQNLKSNCTKVPIIISGKEIFSEKLEPLKMPSDFSVTLAQYSLATEEQMQLAITESLKVKNSWERVPFSEKAKIFTKVADLISTKYRAEMLAATMLGQAKNYYQADIDCIGELVDFIRFNVHYCTEIHKGIELHQPKGISNTLVYRGLDGFIAAIAPFNFMAIGGNLCTAPAMAGNVVIWKPSNAAIVASYLFYKILIESGLPEGVIQFVPCTGKVFGKVITQHPKLSAINFTGSTQTFENLFKSIGDNIGTYESFPRMIGETGGKNFHLLHESANIDHAVNCTIRAAFEYSGQKCSACARLFVPEPMWKEFERLILERVKDIKLGQPDDYKTFLSAVISKPAFERIKSYLDPVSTDSSLQLLCGGKCDDTHGYFVEPTIIKTNDKNHKIMKEEIFGPVLAVYVYKPEEWLSILNHIDSSTQYSLTGAVFSTDKKALAEAEDILLHSCGNLYINDKCTGSLVGHQPFGGDRKSGTNDKPGMSAYMLRFLSPRSRKENFSCTSDVLYEYMK